MNTHENNEPAQPLAVPLERPVRPLVERLRDYAQCSDSDIDEAADEIERLRAALTAIGLQCAADAKGGEWTTAISRVQALVKTGLEA